MSLISKQSRHRLPMFKQVPPVAMAEKTKGDLFQAKCLNLNRVICNAEKPFC